MNKTQAQYCAKLADFPQEVWDKIDRERRQTVHGENETKAERKQRWL